MEPISPFHKDQKTTDTTLNLQEAFAIVATGETALYGNIILKKGVIKEWYSVKSIQSQIFFITDTDNIW